MTQFSIIICTYNPIDFVFKKLLNAIEKLNSEGIEHEILFIDNNSLIPLGNREFMSNFIERHSNAKIILESKPGLTSARIKGISEAKYKWLIFFDDDNEPACDYLVKTSEAIIKYPQTAAWGASEVEVEYVDKPSEWLNKEKGIFQQRNDKFTIISNQSHWQECYPYGTGLIIQRQIALLYLERVIKERYTLTDRKGKSLSSGGDVQLVLTAIEQGFHAGVIAGLKIVHLIDSSKTSLRYLQRLQYGIASAYIKAFNQVFFQIPIPIEQVTNKRILVVIYGLFRIHKPVSTKERFRLIVAAKMGELNARAEINPNRKPLLLKFYEKIIHV